jgi:hypothetical protein
LRNHPLLPAETMATISLEHIFQVLHDIQIRFGLQAEPLQRWGITVWIAHGDHQEKATFYRTVEGDEQIWAPDAIAACSS